MTPSLAVTGRERALLCIIGLVLSIVIAIPFLFCGLVMWTFRR